MLLTLSALALLLAPPLPELRTEATGGGSIFHIRNTAALPLTGYFIELRNYPGSFYQLWQDETNSAPIPPGGRKQIPNSNMTVGAVPEYVKLQAAIFTDGSTAGAPEKVITLQERRRHTLATARELIARLEKAPPATSAELRQWADSIPTPTRSNRNSQDAINNVAAKALILASAAKLESTSPAAVLTTLRALGH
jgi:hypothetical protein